ncbi:MAG: ECF transporter S component [Candidatus Izemoplasmatales bacterium]|jgi:riboflavin transporter FmnP|nr:hypothetical protein [Acholeplasmataceae bacterium]
MTDEWIIGISVVGIVIALLLIYLLARTKHSEKKHLVVQIITGFFIIAGLTFGLAVQDEADPLKILMFDAIILALYFLIIFIVAKLREAGKLKQSVSTRKIAFLGIMVGLASALMLLEFPVVPGYHFLKVELSALMIFMALLWFDFKTALLVSLATNLIHVFMPSTPPVILFMDEGVNFIATMIFIAPTAILVRRQNLFDSEKRPIVTWIVIGSALLTAIVMVLYNYFINLPIIYKMEMPFKSVLEIFGVFNLIKWGLNALVIILLWRRLYALRMISDESEPVSE